MSRALETRLRRLEGKQPQGFEALTDAELDARIEAALAALVREHGTAEALAASFRADRNEMAARHVEEWDARKH